MKWLAGAVGVAILLRFPTLGQQSFWTDEASTALELHGSLGHMLASIRDYEGMPPGYFVLAWLWTRVFGLGEAGLRSMSAVFGVLTVPVAWALARQLRPSAAPACAFLVACSPFLVWFSQEGRPYALLVLVTGLMTLFWVQDRRGRWAAAAAAALLVHYFAVFLILPQAVVLLRRGGWRALLGPAAMAAALLPLVLSQADARVDWITDTSLPSRTVDIAKHFATGEFGTPVNWLALVAVAALAVGAYRARGPVLATAAVAVALPVLVALVGADYVLDRYVIAALVPVLAVVAVGLPRPAALALAALFAVFTVNVWTDHDLQREDWRDFARSLTAPSMIVASPEALRPLQWYLRGRVVPANGPQVADSVVAVDPYRSGRRRPPLPAPPFAFPPAHREDDPTLTVVRYRVATSLRIDPFSLLGQSLSAPRTPDLLVLPR